LQRPPIRPDHFAAIAREKRTLNQRQHWSRALMPKLSTTRSIGRIQDLNDIRALEARPYDELVPAQSIYEVFAATAELYGDRPALTMLGSAQSTDVAIRYTHAELLADITRSANMFFELGLAANGVVAILSRTHGRLPALVLGAGTAGIVSNLNYLLSADVIAALLRAENARVLVCAGPELDAELWAKAQEVCRQVATLDTVLVFGGAPPGADPRFVDADALIDRQPGDHLIAARRPQPHDVAALFHTGGTTGLPKLVPQTHRNQIHAAWSFAQMFDITETDVGLNGFPLFHVGGTSTMGLSILAAGGHVVMLSPNGFRNPEVVKNIWTLVNDFRATILGGVPTTIGAVSEIPVGDNDLSSLRFTLTGGATLPSAVAQRFEARTGVCLLEQYGMTESVATIATTPLHGAHRRGSVGLRGPFSQIAIVEAGGDDTWRPCPPGRVGMVVARGPQIVPAYLDQRFTQAGFTRDGGLITGDLGYLSEDGYLTLTGREKDLIIRSGHNIDPLSIEEVANAHPAVALSAAVGMPDGYAGELPVVFVAPSAGHSIDTAELQQFIGERIAEPPAKPRHVFVLDAIPVTGVGKIFKPALRELALIYKLRMEVGNLPDPVEIVDLSTNDEKGTAATLRLRARSPAEQERCAEALSTALASLAVKVEVHWL
jgi:fatty-acyl-CoA synthase